MRDYRNIFSFDVEWNWKTISLLASLAVFPNILGLFQSQIFGVRIHYFQYLVFLAAIIYGPSGGIISGAFGSVFTAVVLHNPYIIIGNMLLGGLTGIFLKYKLHIIIAALLAYLIQLPWLWITDVYLAHMPVSAVKGIVVALLVSNFIWAFFAGLTAKHIKKIFA